jgi:hypothetical protein
MATELKMEVKTSFVVWSSVFGLNLQQGLEPIKEPIPKPPNKNLFKFLFQIKPELLHHLFEK